MWSAGLTSVMKLLSCCLALYLLIFWCILLSFSSSSKSAQRQWRYELRHKRHKDTKCLSKPESARVLVANMRRNTGDHALLGGKCWLNTYLQVVWLNLCVQLKSPLHFSLLAKRQFDCCLDRHQPVEPMTAKTKDGQKHHMC